MKRACWVGTIVAVAAALALIFAFGGLRLLRRAVSSVSATDAPRQSDLLAHAFATPAEAETFYRPAQTNTLEFHKDIAPIVYEKCASCHNAKSAAPFALTSYGEVKSRARRIARAVHSRLMPPWKADRGFTEFAGDQSLTLQEQGTLEQWIAEGCREGTETAGVPAPTPRPRWPNGAPDLAVKMTEKVTIPAEGEDIYRCFVIPTNYSEDRYVRLADVVPGNPRVVHHAFVFADSSGAGRNRDAAEPGPGFTVFGGLGFDPASQLGFWVPGASQQPLPAGTGYLLPKGADIILQLHYHPTGKEESDLSGVELYLCDAPVDKRVRIMPIAVRPRLLQIPAGDNNAVFWAEQEVPGAITVLKAVPHMHYLARQTAAAATLPDGSTIPLVRISDWDFRWQNAFTFKTPIRLPERSRVRFETRFDNSEANPRNPNHPPRLVKFGTRTTDEMCLLYLFYTVDSESLTQNRPATANYPDSFLKFKWGIFAGGRK